MSCYITYASIYHKCMMYPHHSYFSGVCKRCVSVRSRTLHRTRTESPSRSWIQCGCSHHCRPVFGCCASTCVRCWWVCVRLIVDMLTIYMHVLDHKFILWSCSFCRGGVMLVHDITKNKTRVINFQGTAPKTLKEDMLQSVSELKVI